jgi:hypothetical protein
MNEMPFWPGSNRDPDTIAANVSKNVRNGQGKG